MSLVLAAGAVLGVCAALGVCGKGCASGVSGAISSGSLTAKFLYMLECIKEVNILNIKIYIQHEKTPVGLVIESKPYYGVFFS